MSAEDFDPTTVKVGRGRNVVWDNADASVHRVLDGTGLGLFELTLDPAGFAAHAFIAAGRYRYVNADDPAVFGSVGVPVGTSLVRGSRTMVAVTWASRNAADGYAYDVQVRRPGGKWRRWLDDVVRASASFKADVGAGTYRFRACMVSVDGARARWSVDDAIRVGS